MTPTGVLRRCGPARVWQLAAEPVLPEESPDEPVNPLSVLESDTVLGLLLLGLLPMLHAELRTTHSTSQHAALQILTAVVLTGPEAALSVAACKPLLASLRGIQMKLLEGSAWGYEEGDMHVHLHALFVMRLIVASGGDAAAEVAAAGALDMPRAALLSPQWSTAAQHPLAAPQDDTSAAKK